MKSVSLPAVLAALLLSAVVSLPFLPGIDRERQQFALVLQMQVSTSGQAQLFYDDGAGYREPASVRASVGYSPAALEYRFPIPPGTYRSFRFDPLVGEGTIRIESAQVVNAGDDLVRSIALEDFRPNDHFQSSTMDETGLTAIVRPGANDPQLIVPFAPQLKLSTSWIGSAGISLAVATSVFAIVLAVLYGLKRSTSCRRALQQVADWGRRRPTSAVLLVAAAAAIMSCYPIVFFGKSFVSPSFSDGSVLLYGRFPTLPGYTDATVENAMGADVGPMAWQNFSYAVVQHEALFRDQEFPIWNRYNSTGAPLWGQGLSMFGDPLHFLPVIANGASWAWDLKYLVAKWLFCAALALAVFHSTRFLPGALITAVSAAFIGFFVYRVNHPAFFSLCYAPWILFAWLRIQSASDARALVTWIAVLMLANWSEMNTGTAKEAYMLIVFLNLTGVALVCGSPESWKEKRIKLAWLCAFGLLFILLSSPTWLTFLIALKQSYTAYDVPNAHQIYPSLLLGLFDEIFYRHIQTNERVFNPSVNFLVLMGILYVVATFRRAPANRLKLILTLGAIPSFALAFGIFPPEWIVEIPFLGNVAHIDNTFSCVLIIHLLVLAGFGYQLAAQRLATPEGRGDLLMCGFLLLILMLPWIAMTHTILKAAFGPETVFRLLENGQHLPVSNFVWASLVVLPLAASGLGAVIWTVRQRGNWTATAALLALTCTLLILWRHGQHLRYGFSDYVYNPGMRVDHFAKSDAIEFVRADSSDPYRAIGVYDNLVPGWSAVYGIEAIAGPDPLVNPHYRALTDALGLERIWDWRIFVRPEHVDALKRSYEFLNVRYLMDLPTGGAQQYSSWKSAAQLDLEVFTSDETWPRAFFTDRMARYNTPADLGHLVRTEDGRPFAAVERLAVGFPHDLPADLQNRTVVPATNYRLTSTTTAFDVQTPGEGVVVLHEASMPDDFQATLDGESVDYFMVNQAFKGIYIADAGLHRITFRYWPRGFSLSLVLCGLGLAGSVLLFAVAWRLPRPSPEAN